MLLRAHILRIKIDVSAAGKGIRMKKRLTRFSMRNMARMPHFHQFDVVKPYMFDIPANGSGKMEIEPGSHRQAKRTSRRGEQTSGCGRKSGSQQKVLFMECILFHPKTERIVN